MLWAFDIVDNCKMLLACNVQLKMVKLLILCKVYRLNTT